MFAVREQCFLRRLNKTPIPNEHKNSPFTLLCWDTVTSLRGTLIQSEVLGKQEVPPS